VAIIFNYTGKNSGKDVSVLITAYANGNQVGQWYAAQLGIVTHFEVSTDYSNFETKSIVNGGAVFYESLPHGAKCSLKIVRSGNAASAGLEDLESMYRQSSYDGVQLSFTVQYYTTNRDGSANIRSLTNCKPHNWNLGAYAADSDVTQSVDFMSTDINNSGISSAIFPAQ
jgi:hypothetical protein